MTLPDFKFLDGFLIILPFFDESVLSGIDHNHDFHAFGGLFTSLQRIQRTQKLRLIKTGNDHNHFEVFRRRI